MLNTIIKKGGVFIDDRHLIEIVNKQLSQRMDMTREHSDAELKKLISACIEEIKARIPGVNINETHLLAEVFNARRRMGVIQPFLENPAVNEIMINGTDNIFVEINGVMRDSGIRYNNKEELFHNIQAMLSQSNRSVSESNPIVDAVLPGGARINVVLNPVAINGPIVTIRKFTKQQYTMEDFIRNATLTEEMAAYIKHAVFEGKSIIISGSTSSGKTTFMNLIAGFIPEDKRIITIEDSAELNIKSRNAVRLETRTANTEGHGEIKMRALIKAALRMRPDRLLIGEVRDESALELLTAMCTGHSGSMSTIHANSAEDTLIRLETMALWEGHVHSEAIRRMIVSGVDVVVFLERNEKGRRVREIAEVCKNEKKKIQLRKVF